jgi:hypothetical protein
VPVHDAPDEWCSCVNVVLLCVGNGREKPEAAQGGEDKGTATSGWHERGHIRPTSEVGARFVA